jgi:hypothetical protein
MYKPTLFLPIDLAEKINAVIDPINSAIKTLAAQQKLNPLVKPLVEYNLYKINEFKQRQQDILHDYDNYISQRAMHS